MFAWFFLSALYLQLVLGYSPLQVGGHFAPYVLPSMILLGVGAGMALNPVLLAAMSDVDLHESGLASGVVNTSFMMGGALGLAVLASVAASRTGALLGSGAGHLSALDGGYHVAFLVGAAFAAAAALLAAIMLRGAAGAPVAAGGEAHALPEGHALPEASA
jgi:hypothetical protein